MSGRGGQGRLERMLTETWKLEKRAKALDEELSAAREKLRAEMETAKATKVEIADAMASLESSNVSKWDVAILVRELEAGELDVYAPRSAAGAALTSRRETDAEFARRTEKALTQKAVTRFVIRGTR